MSGWQEQVDLGASGPIPKRLPENTDGEVRSATWMTGLLKCCSEKFDPALMIAMA